MEAKRKDWEEVKGQVEATLKQLRINLAINLAVYSFVLEKLTEPETA